MTSGPPFPSDSVAAAYYGMTRPGWMKLKALGRKQKDELPFTSPAEMPAWFDRMRAAGLRKHKTPDAIIQRAAEAGDGQSTAKPAKVRPQKNGRSAPKAVLAKETPPAPDPPRPPALPFEDATPASNTDTITHMRRMASFYAAEWEAATKSGRKADALEAKRAFDDLSEKIRKWSQSQKAISEGEGYIPRDQVVAGANAFCSGLWRVLTRELEAEFTGAESPRVRKVLVHLEKALPPLLAKEFQPAA